MKKKIIILLLAGMILAGPVLAKDFDQYTDDEIRDKIEKYYKKYKKYKKKYETCKKNDSGDEVNEELEEENEFLKRIVEKQVFEPKENLTREEMEKLNKMDICDLCKFKFYD